MEKYIPQRFLFKMNTYNMKIGGLDVKATVSDDDLDSMACCLTAIKSSVKNLPVVGIDVKRCSPGCNAELLLIYAENHCLIVRLGRLNYVPSVLSSFLADESICFVGMKIENFINLRPNLFNEGKRTLQLRPVEIGYLAGRVLKSRNLQRCESLVELARKTGDFKEVSWKTSFASTPPDWKEGIFFEQEEVEYAMQDVYLCYNIGKKLLGSLG